MLIRVFCAPAWKRCSCQSVFLVLIIRVSAVVSYWDLGHAASPAAGGRPKPPLALCRKRQDGATPPDPALNSFAALSGALLNDQIVHIQMLWFWPLSEGRGAHGSGLEFQVLLGGLSLIRKQPALHKLGRGRNEAGVAASILARVCLFE